MSQRQTSTKTEKGWLSWKLNLWWTVPILFLEFAIFSTLIGLTAVSETSDGFAAISNKPLLTVGGHNVNQHILWTSFPVFVLTLLKIASATIAATAAERQPYVELVDKPKRSNAKLTILLDYQSYPALYNWFVAFLNGHHHLGGALLVHFVCSFALAPLTASVFRAAQTQIERDITLRQLNEVNFRSLNEITDLQPAIDLAGAIRAYGAKPLTWMTSEIAFDPFTTAELPKDGDVTAHTNAYHVKAQCESIELDQSSSQGQDISFNDRGCQIEKQWPGGSIARLNSYTWSEVCSDAVVPLDRVGIFAGPRADDGSQSLANITVISCLPVYYNVTTDLTMSFDIRGAHNVLNFHLGDPTQIRLLNLRSIISNLPNYRLSSISDGFAGDTFGNAVHSYVSILSPHSEFRPEVYRQATEEIFTTMFAVLATRQVQRRTPVLEFIGQAAVVGTHLYVSVPVAAVICALLALMMLCTIRLIVYVSHSSVISTEEPVGLLGRALLLLRSEVMVFAKDLESRHPDGALIDHVNRDYTLKDSECWLDGNIGSGSQKIMLANLKPIEPGDQVRSLWRRLFRRSTARKNERQSVSEDGSVELRERN